MAIIEYSLKSSNLETAYDEESLHNNFSFSELIDKFIIETIPAAG